MFHQTKSRPTNSPRKTDYWAPKTTLQVYPTRDSLFRQLANLRNTVETTKLFSYDQQRSPAIQRASQEPKLHLTHWEALYTKENFSVNVEITWKSWYAIPKTFVKALKTPDFFGSQRS